MTIFLAFKSFKLAIRSADGVLMSSVKSIGAFNAFASGVAETESPYPSYPLTKTTVSVPLGKADLATLVAVASLFPPPSLSHLKLLVHL